MSNNNERAHPWLLVYDKTNSRVKLYNDLEAVTGTFNALTMVGATASMGFGGTPFPRAPVSGVYLYGAFCTGTLAESFSDNTTASLFFKTLGWNPTW